MVFCQVEEMLLFLPSLSLFQLSLAIFFSNILCQAHLPSLCGAIENGSCCMKNVKPLKVKHQHMLQWHLLAMYYAGIFKGCIKGVCIGLVSTTENMFLQTHQRTLMPNTHWNNICQNDNAEQQFTLRVTNKQFPYVHRNYIGFINLNWTLCDYLLYHNFTAKPSVVST